MANPEHVKLVLQGAAAIAEWRRRNPDVRLDLREADLPGANLSEADLHGADLTDTDLTGADLARANLREADLTMANLHGAELRGADLRGADLTRADLARADLRRADFAAAKLLWAHLAWTDIAGAHVAGAHLAFTSLSNCDLSRVTGLSSVDHMGPSSIGVDTLIASFRGAGNRLTRDLETFFLGAGVPKELLAELPRIVGAVEYHSCFIAYGQPDLDFAKRLRDDLAAKGVSCWLYALDATPGERKWAEIGRERRQADKMLIICSVAALIRDGVLKEIEDQIDEDPNKIVPISRDNLWNQPGFLVMRGSQHLKPFVDDRNYADFGDDSRYEESLQRLLRALRRKAE